MSSKATRSAPPGGMRVDPDLFPPPQRAARHRSHHQRKVLGLVDQLAGAAADLLALTVPVDCVCCGAEDSALCHECDRRIRRLTKAPFRAESGAPVLMDIGGRVLLPVVAAGVYREELAQALLSFKRHGQHRIRASLGRALAGAVRAAAGEGETACLIPVPTSSAAYLRRGFSPVQLLLAEAARQLQGVQHLDVLVKNGQAGLALPGGQKGLDRGARAKRVRSSMKVRRRAGGRLAGRRCIVVDDVLTTGSTLAEAARALHQAGAIVTGAVVLAATRPPDAASGSHASGQPVKATMT
ncbi:ComF family protein [Pseudarthrobacter sp. NamE2]|uniref:ComF family protein n=1 Tax=Pseudarthrobacter sp. NamE2 TaxID=2576838 RepID=UPI0010FEA34F|nr:phosphoribosyltransferase family protein [Pseudarthrobacter sp. NamE2]TLM85630.1 ComF family protein [Pseudarthrobacter sp. NamE2]